MWFLVIWLYELVALLNPIFKYWINQTPCSPALDILYSDCVLLGERYTVTSLLLFDFLCRVRLLSTGDSILLVQGLFPYPYTSLLSLYQNHLKTLAKPSLLLWLPGNIQLHRRKQFLLPSSNKRILSLSKRISRLSRIRRRQSQ